jgi:DNA-binding MarR family transcriptional regulator/GNAT superfamily N-acetyltransferase
MPSGTSSERVEAVRAFNRLITARFGILERGLLGTNHSLTEARVIYELAQDDQLETPVLRSLLGIDSGYISRLLGRLEARRLIKRERSKADARRHVVRLTGRGHEAFAVLDRRSTEQVEGVLGDLSDRDQRRLVGGMNAVRSVLEGRARDNAIVTRSLGPGDYGWVVQRHGALYASEYGWDETFEALVARIVADYVDDRDPRRSSAWIAELDGRPAGCVFCTEKDARTAQLRLLLVEPDARGRGLGGRLVDECLRFARRARYERISLWTNDVLADARRVYERAGFELVDEETHQSFGQKLVGQTWQRDLAPSGSSE